MAYLSPVTGFPVPRGPRTIRGILIRIVELSLTSPPPFFFLSPHSILFMNYAPFFAQRLYIDVISFQSMMFLNMEDPARPP